MAEVNHGIMDVRNVLLPYRRILESQPVYKAATEETFGATSCAPLLLQTICNMVGARRSRPPYRNSTKNLETHEEFSSPFPVTIDQHTPGYYTGPGERKNSFSEKQRQEYQTLETSGKHKSKAFDHEQRSTFILERKFQREVSTRKECYFILSSTLCSYKAFSVVQVFN